MSDNYVIPYELVFYYPAREELNKFYSSQISQGYLLATGTSESAKSSTKLSARGYFENYTIGQRPRKTVGPAEDNEITKVVTLRNQGFRIEIPHIGHDQDYIAIDSDEIQEKIGKKLLIHMPYYSLFSLLLKAKNMTNLVLAGTYCFSSSTSQDCNLTAHLEDSSDTVLEKSREAGVKMSATKMTSKWIPGHKYVLKNDSKYILYLGDLKNVLAGNDFPWQKKLVSRFFNFSGGNGSYYSSFVEEGVVYLELTPDVQKLIKDYEGKPLPDFIHNFFMNPKGWKALSSYVWIRDTKAEQKLTGADMGEYMTLTDNYDLNFLVKSICGTIQAEPKNFEGLLNCRNELSMYSFLAPDLVNTNKDIVSRIHVMNKDYIKKYIKDRCTRYWGSPKVEIKDLTLGIVKTQFNMKKEDIFKLIDKFAPITDSEFDKMIETSITELQRDGK